MKARLNLALILSMLLCLRGTRTLSNVDNISEIDLCAIAADSNIEWITYRFIPCYFAIMNMYGYIYIIFLDIFCIYTLWTDDLRLIFERIDAYVFI